MRCPRQPLAGDVQQMKPPQPLGGPGPFWPPYPPQAVYSPWMMPSQYPTMYPMPPFSQLQPPVAGPGERPLWFQALVEAVSKEIKHDEKNLKAAVDNEDLSAEDEKALIDALKKQKEGGSTMQQVFQELSQKNGRPEIVWKTWFIANFENLNSKVNLSPDVGHPWADDRSSAGSSGSSNVASRTRSTSNNQLLRSSTTIATNGRELSPEEESESESEWEKFGDGLTSTSHNSNGSSPRDAPQPRSKANAGSNSSQPTRPPRSRQPVWVTDADLRAMAQYRVEKGDDREIRRYSYTRWREFAQRPENRKRTLAAWTCIPRQASHKAAIDQYVREYQLLAEGVAESKAGLAVLLLQDNHAISSPGARERRLAVETSPKETANAENGIDGSKNRASRCADPEDIIDLTAEEET